MLQLWCAGTISSLLRLPPCLRPTGYSANSTSYVFLSTVLFHKKWSNFAYTCSFNTFCSLQSLRHAFFVVFEKCLSQKIPTEVQSPTITIAIQVRIIYHTDDNILKIVFNVHGSCFMQAAFRVPPGTQLC